MCNERVDGLEPIEKIMIWTEQEAIVKQVTQIGTSACGATSAINALVVMNITILILTCLIYSLFFLY